MIVLQLSHSHHGHLLCQRNSKKESCTFIRQHADAMHHNRRIDYLLYNWRQTERECSSSWKKARPKKYTLNIFLLAIIFLTMKNATLRSHKYPSQDDVFAFLLTLSAAIVCVVFPVNLHRQSLLFRLGPAHHTTPKRTQKVIKIWKTIKILLSFLRFYCRMVINYLIN